MAVNTLLVKAYAINIYLYGNRTFATIPTEYHEPVKQYAAQTFTQEQIYNALVNGWITQQEYDETMAYKTA
ncbi:hypothetical protein LH47_02044 [Anoxybacillus thermarum]|uniref:XkdX family protein n=1 Tax=Anoxybacillus thermarum TaxID=404937 RepID=A0A0D0QWQ3_9BACL|nr:hypothetical protein [Anoxybacillus thermarum]KIQ93894.1 hypothetical protein LH47_02044 [Anoxybacillus thermarum]